MLTRRDQRRVDRVCMTCVRIAAILALSRPPGPAWAQGGPPMVTDDPDTPGNELGNQSRDLRQPQQRTLGNCRARRRHQLWWGDRVQLKLDLPWTFVRSDDGDWKSGLGAAQIGVKWRFMDSDEAGFSRSTSGKRASYSRTAAPRRSKAWAKYTRH